MDEKNVIPLTSDNDSWNKAVSLLTGYKAPERHTLFDELLGNEKIKQMKVEISKQGYVDYVDPDDFNWRVENAGFNIQNTDFVIPFYMRGGSNGHGVTMYKARITLLGNKNGDGAPVGGVVEGGEFKSQYDNHLGLTGEDAVWTTAPLTQYAYGTGRALERMLDNENGTYGWSWNGKNVANDQAVSLKSFDTAAAAFDRVGEFFSRQQKIVEEWQRRVGTEQDDAWRGQAAGVFWNLIHTIDRQYSGYAKDMGFTGTHSKQGNEIREAKDALSKAARTLQTSWAHWELHMGNPLRWLHDLLVEVTDHVWERNITQITYKVQSVARGGTRTTYHPTSLMDDTATRYGKSDNFGKLTDLSTWKAIGEMAVSHWQASVIENLVEPANAALDEIHNKWSSTNIDLGTVRTRGDDDLTSSYSEDKAAKEKADAEAAAAAAQKKNDDFIAWQKAEAEKAKAEAAKAKAEQEAKEKAAKAEQEAKEAKAKAEQEAKEKEAKAEQERKEKEAKAEQAAKEAEAEQKQAAAEAKAEQKEAQAKAEQEAKEKEAKAEQAAKEAEAEQKQAAAEAKAEEKEAQAKAEQEAKEAEAKQAQARAEQLQISQFNQSRADQESARKEQERKQAEAEAAAAQKEAEAKAEQEAKEKDAEQKQAAAEAKAEEKEAQAKAEQEAKEKEAKAEQAAKEAEAEQKQAAAEAKAEQKEAEAKAEQEAKEKEAEQKQAAAEAKAEQKEAEAKAEQEAKEKEARAEQEAKEAEVRAEQEKAQKRQEEAWQQVQGGTGGLPGRGGGLDLPDGTVIGSGDLNVGDLASQWPDRVDANPFSGDVLTNPGGSHTTLDAHDRLVTQFPDGSSVRIDPDLHTATVTHPDGTVETGPLNVGDLLPNPDGSVTRLGSDGNIVTEFPDGTVSTVDPRTGIGTTTLPDGTVSTGDLNGSPGGLPTAPGFHSGGTSPGSLPGASSGYDYGSYEEELYDESPYESPYAASGASTAAASSGDGGTPLNTGSLPGGLGMSGLNGAGGAGGMPMGMPMGGMGGMGGAGGGNQAQTERVRNVIDDGQPLNSRGARRGPAARPVQDENNVRVSTPRATGTTGSSPFVPVGGAGAPGGRPQTQSGDRAREVWAEEEDDVWGTDDGGAPAVIGR
ncbi:AAWKG family protein [Streptomyces sp. NPDC086091]|uniref:AAWKG family protein n=1 Tax=Streptomyces sp. NPDC086091 TaxID=3365751 RepID=UPI00380BD072